MFADEMSLTSPGIEIFQNDLIRLVYPLDDIIQKQVEPVLGFFRRVQCEHIGTDDGIILAFEESEHQYGEVFR